MSSIIMWQLLAHADQAPSLSLQYPLLFMVSAGLLLVGSFLLRTFFLRKKRAVLGVMPQPAAALKGSELLRLALALAFFAHAMIAFSAPEGFEALIEGSFFLQDLIPQPELFIFLAGIHDITLSFLLALRIFPSIMPWWAAAWIAGVLIIFFSQQSGLTPLLLTGIYEDITLLFLAVFLARNNTL